MAVMLVIIMVSGGIRDPCGDEGGDGERARW